jgi:hypothetical protein
MQQKLGIEKDLINQLRIEQNNMSNEEFYDLTGLYKEDIINFQPNANLNNNKTGLNYKK